MRIEISVEKAGPIGVVDELPEGRILRLIGKNGVGKSLAANLLSIASGTYTFRERLSFTSLQNVLARVRIVIHGPGHTLKADLSPPTWRWNEKYQRPDFSASDKFDIDGAPTSSEEFAKQFSCSIVRGNETLSTQLLDMGRSLIAAYNVIFERLTPKAVALASHVLQVRKALQSETLDLITLRSQDLEKQRTLIGIDSTPVLALADFVHSVIETKVEVDLGRPVSQALERIREARERAIEELGRIDRQITAVEKTISAAARVDVNTLVSDLSKIQEEISRTRGGLPLRQMELQSIDGVRQESTKLAERLKELDAKSTEYQRLRFALQVQSDIPATIAHREVDYRIRNIPTRDVPLLFLRKPPLTRTAQQVISDFAHSSRATRKRVESSASTELAAEYSRTEDHLKSLAEQKDLLMKLEELERRAGRTGEKLASKAGRAAKELERAVELQRECRKRIESLDRAAKTASNHPRLFRGEKVTLAQLCQQYANTQVASLQDAGATLESLRPSLESLEAERRSLQLLIQRYLETVSREGLDALPPKVRTAVRDRDIPLLTRFTKRLDPISNSTWVELTRQDVEARILWITSPEKSGETVVIDPFYDLVNGLLGKILKHTLNEPPFRRFVFEGREVQDVDPSAGIVTLVNHESRVTQSLEDFSSGQRAFAYSLASISSKHRDAEMVLLVLDEFGALLDEDRTQYLISHVKELMGSRGWPTSTLIVLPYKGDLDQMRKDLGATALSDAARKLEEDRINDYAHALHSKGYYVKVVE